jgi:hypothetical protein
MKINLTEITINLSIDELKILFKAFDLINDDSYNRFSQSQKNLFQTVKQELYEIASFFNEYAKDLEVKQ